MFKKITAAAAAIALMLSLFNTSFADGISKKQYIVKLKEQNVLLMNSDTHELPYDVVDENVLAKLLDSGLVQWYEEDYTAELFDEPAKKYDDSKWDLEMVGADFTYYLNCEGQDVRIGVIDSGIAEHEDLADNVLSGYDYANDTYDTADTYGHGTFVSGIIAALDNEKGIIGLSPKAKIVPLKCFNEKSAYISVVCKAIYGAVDEFGCDIINMSFGISEDSEALREAIDYAADKGVIIVAAVGNSGNTNLCYPAAYDNVIGVGSVNKNGKYSTASQYNKSVYVTAPGDEVKSTSINGGYTIGSGTSYATPFVTAAAAVMLNIDPDLDLNRFKDILSAASVDKGDEGYDEYYGHGILNVKNCAELMLKDTNFFISPVDAKDGQNTAVVYNNTNDDFSGQLFIAEYNGNKMKNLSRTVLSLPAKETITINNPVSEYSKKYFVWKDIENISPISNERSVSAEENTDDSLG